MISPTSRVVRVFISSTFRDFGAERDLLIKRVFLELRRRPGGAAHMQPLAERADR